MPLKNCEIKCVKRIADYGCNISDHLFEARFTNLSLLFRAAYNSHYMKQLNMRVIPGKPLLECFLREKSRALFQAECFNTLV